MLKRNSITSIISAVNKEDVETKFKAQLYSGENENGMKRYVVSLTVYSKTDVWDNIEVMHDIVYNFHTLKHNPQESDETWNLILTQEEVDDVNNRLNKINKNLTYDKKIRFDFDKNTTDKMLNFKFNYFKNLDCFDDKNNI